jgi:hypothetical protein
MRKILAPLALVCLLAACKQPSSRSAADLQGQFRQLQLHGRPVDLSRSPDTPTLPRPAR